jgi:hypothetical protein
MTSRLHDLAGSPAAPVTRRLLAEYGAVFVTRATPPPTILFADAQEVNEFQRSVSRQRARVGDYEVELQSAALEALLVAAADVAGRGGALSARAADSGRRTYEETVALWARNVGRGLSHWQGLGRLDAARAGSIQQLSPVEQVAVILELEEREEIYFGTFFNRSILYSVAAPGASQHLSMLAFDVAEYKDEQVEQALNRVGWHRTVLHDLPHFTYLGYETDALPELGLRQVAHEYDGFQCRYWVPDLK